MRYATARRWPRFFSNAGHHDSFSSIGFSQLVRSAPAMLVDGAVGLVWAPVGRLSRVLRFTITRGKIVQVEIIADPARLRDLDLAVIKE
jgi:hypothetical protein